MSGHDEADDRTVGMPSHEVDDQTVVVPSREVDDHTVVAPSREVDDHTVVAPSRAEGAEVLDDRTVVAAAADLDLTVVAPEMFKRPPAPSRPAADPMLAPGTEDTRQAMPSRGVRPNMPVVYAKRSGAEITADPARVSVLEQRVGPPPTHRPLPVADRDALPSTERANRRFRRVVLVGFACSIVVSLGGLYYVAAELLG